MTKYYLDDKEVSQEEAYNLIPVLITEERVDLRHKNSEELISDYKDKLKKTDYKAIKYAEGLISEEDYVPIKAERQMLRTKINELEKNIK